VTAFVAALPLGARALVIRGEAGIGKTTVWRLAVERCRQAGFEVLVARPAEEEMPLALGALVDLFERIPLETSPLEQDDDPIARGRAVLAALRRLAERRPVVVAIDDLQWLDAASSRALRFALRRLDAEPVGVLAALRSSSDVEDPLATANNLPPARAAALELGPLSLAALRRVLRPIVEAISRPTLRRIHEVSGGNPLYAIELARGLLRDERVRQGVGALHLPDSLQAAIARRLETIPVELEPLLETVSALGFVSVAQLGATLSDANVDALLQEAERWGLLVVEENLAVRYSHPLIGSAVYQRMSPLARRSLHANLAARATDPDVRARHLALSLDEPDVSVAELLEQAAGRARMRGASVVAAEFAGHALRLTPAQDLEAHRRRALAEIEDLEAAGEVSRALALADSLLAILSPGSGRAEVVFQLAVMQDDGEKAVELLEQAREEAGEDDLLRARVLLELAAVGGTVAGGIDGPIALAREALDIAERVGEPRFLMRTLAGLGYLEALAGSARPELTDRAVALEAEMGSSTGGSQTPRTLLARQLLWAGDLAGARELNQAVLADTVDAGDEFKRPYRLADLALVECAAGNLTAAETLVRQGIEAARDAEDAYGERVLQYPLALVETLLGRAEEARSAAQGLLAAEIANRMRPGIVRARYALGLLSLSEGDAPGAGSELVEAARLLEESGIGQPAALAPALPDAVEALASAGREEEAATLLGRLGRQAAAVDSPWPWAAYGRSRGIVLLASGDADGAITLLEDSAASFDRLGYRLDAARSVLACGRAQLRGGRRTVAANALADARARFAGMGATLWEERAAEELERAASGRATGELTRSERRIAVLVAQGRKNREIAQTLYMSVATVEAHLTRIYRKLGIRSRAELARLVVERSIRVSEDDGT
jgi:DNA-binding CsgD family transcriptional regulator